MELKNDSMLLLLIVMTVHQALGTPAPQTRQQEKIDDSSNSTLSRRINLVAVKRNPLKAQTRKSALTYDCGDTYCVSDPNYPTEVIQSLENELKKYEYLFGDDFVDIISTRFDSDEMGLCESRKRLIHPRRGMTADNTWMTIVNNENYRQGVSIEECSSASSPCEYSRNFPLGVESKCKQMYVYRNLLAINTEGKPVTEHFQFPSCCKCVVTSSRSYRRSSDDHERKDRLILS